MKKPPPKVVHDWLSSLGQGGVSVLTVEGPPQARDHVFSWCSAVRASKWRENGFRNEVVQELLLAYQQTLFKRLLHAENLILDDPLKTMVDRGFYFVSDAFKVFLEAKFQVAEGWSADAHTEAVTRWVLNRKLEPCHLKLFEAAKVSRRVTQSEQLDFLFFVAALGAQSGISTPTTLALDAVELTSTVGKKDRRVFLNELEEIVFGALRWEKLGSSLGVVLGTEDSSLLTPKLSRLLESSIKLPV